MNYYLPFEFFSSIQKKNQTILSTGAPQKQVVGWIQLW